MSISNGPLPLSEESPGFAIRSDLAVRVLRWRANGRQVLTVAVRVSFRLQHLGIAQVEGEAEWRGDEAVWASTPVKGAADVIVLGEPRIPRKGRCLAGVAVARGTEMVWSKRLVASSVAGEPRWTTMGEGTADFGAPRAGESRDAVGDDEDLSALSSVSFDQRMPFLRGGEQLLIVGFGNGDLMTRLPAMVPAVTARFGGSRRVVPLVGDTLEIDASREMAAVTWRGHVMGLGVGGEPIEAELLPLVAVEEVAGTPPAWLASPVRARPERPTIAHEGALSAMLLPPVGGRWPVVAKGAFDVVPGAPLEPSASPPSLSGDVYFDDDPAASLRYPSDFVPTKRGVDVVATGHIHGRNSATVAHSRLQLGPIDKRIAAIGARHWKRDDTPSAPEPVDRVPIRYEMAFGGAEIVSNPIGLDRGEPPRLELPTQLMRTRASRPAPACFAPIPPRWRLEGADGTFDGRWRQERWPDLPDDCDPALYNCAPLDQRCESLRGDEAFVVTSVRPEGGDIAGRLPGIRPWCFALVAEAVERVPLTLDTVVIECDQPSLTLVWRGGLKERAEVSRLWLALRGLDAEPTLAEAWGRLHAIADGRFTAPRDSTTTTLGEVRAALRGAEKALALHATARPAERPRAPVATRAQILGWLDTGDLAGRDLSGADLRGLDLSGRDLSGCILSGAQLDDARLDGARCSGATMTRIGARRSSWIGADLSRADASEAMLEGAVLTEADLSQARFAGARLTAGSLERVAAEGATFTDARLDRANLAGARLARADLTRALLTEASLEGADLTHAKLYDAEGKRLILDRAVLTGARLTGARLPALRASAIVADQSVWEVAELSDAVMPSADLTDAVLNDVILDRADLAGARAKGARLRGASLRSANLSRADFMHADLERADLTRADLRAASLYGAETRDASFAGARLDDAHLTGTKLAPT
jgi:uncharacterized protein YjbI with pentapeptide repeats